MRKIIIDTDPGHDDAMALMLAVKSGKFDIKAITTVAGNSTIENTTRNATFIMKLLDSDIPIFSGAKKPLNRKLVLAKVHGLSGLEGIDPNNKFRLTNNAVDKIISLVKENPNEITIVTLGPLTNVAKAILKDPKSMMKVKEIVSMGGAVRVAGNQNRVSEFNFFVDPEAAKVVMNFPADKTIVPLDACNHVLMGYKDFEKIKNEELKKVLLKMIKPYIKNLGKDSGVKAALMYDPLTIFYLLSKKSCKVQSYNIDIETKGELTRGMSVSDLRNVKESEITNCKVVEKIKAKDFINYFISTLSK